MAHRNVVLIGASAGGVEALRELVPHLTADLPASLALVVHLAPTGTSALPLILSRAGPLPARAAANAAPFENGAIVVAPPDRHLLFHGRRVRLTRGPRENGHRPAIDPMFRSGTRWFGPSVIGVVLSGTLDDGTAGAAAIKSRGGLVIAQDPSDALYSGMPSAVIEHGLADHVLPAAKIGALLADLVRERVPDVDPAPPNVADVEAHDDDMAASPESPGVGAPSAFTCPECNGPLFELREGELVRYRCHVGHAFAPKSLAAYHHEHVEEAIWTAFRALKESAALSQRLADRARQQGYDAAARQYERRAEDATERARSLERMLETAIGDDKRAGSA